MRAVTIHSLSSALRHRASIALLDQAAVSIASFGTGILLSRAFGAEQRQQLGLYYLAVTIGILIVELQNALVCTPLTVTAPTLAPEGQRRLNGSAMIHQASLSAIITLSLALSALAIGLPSHKPMMFTCAITAVAVGLRNFARYLNFSLHRPHIACFADWLVTCLQLAGIVTLIHWHWLSASSAVAVIGIASLIGGVLALLLSKQYIKPDLRAAWADFRDNWRLSRWVFASGIMGNVGTSIYPWILDTFSSTLQAAVWGNCNTVSSVGNPLLMGLQNWMAPAVAHAYTDRSRQRFAQYVNKLASLFLIILPGMLLLLGVLSKPLLQHLYRDFSPNTTLLVFLLAAGSLFQSVGFIYSRALFSLGRGAIDVWTNVIPVLVLCAVGIPLSRQYGAIGGALSLLFAQILSTVVRAGLFWTVCESPADRAEPNEAIDTSAALPRALVEAT